MMFELRRAGSYRLVDQLLKAVDAFPKGPGKHAS